ncbi:MAG: protein kinase [Alcanivoracaceae bacterium]|nr:protein kinase [Alcanivoracaceae bacterium]
MRSKVLKTIKNIDLKISGLRIISKIGEGGMSVVYLAEQISLKREVAVKVMRLEIASNDLDVQRFKHEAKTIAHLDHPNIINIYNIGQTEKGEIFFTMPYLNHGDFSNYLLEDEQEFIELLKSVCDGLSFAHDRGVVHRDIKPENLLFDKFGNVRIADFGIAISKDGARMTKEHQVVGSAQYMSPEQARSLKVDVHSDIYSLGIVIYERLTGNVPFDSDESISILVNHVSTEPPKLPAKMRHWQKLIDKCLAKSPRDRFQSMVELKIELAKIPVNGLQRTNKSIQQLLAGDKGKHLKWFVPSLIVLLIVALIGMNKSTDIEGEPTPITVEKKDLEEKDDYGSKENALVKKEDTPAAANNRLPAEILMDAKPENTIVEQSPVTEEIKEDASDLSIEEIKQELKVQLSPIDTVIEGITGVIDGNVTEEVSSLLDKAFKNIESYQLSKPAKDNATDQLLQVLTLSPDNLLAKDGLESIGGKYFYLIDSSLKKFDFNTALKHSRSVMAFNEKTSNINQKFNIQKTTILKTASQLDISATKISAEQVRTLARVVKVFSPDNPLLEKLNDESLLKSGPQIGEKLLDELGIETILISKKLAVSTQEITVEDYAMFAKETNRKATKCKHKGGGMSNFFSNKTWDKPYFKQSQNHPVSCVSWDDAHAYTLWLSKQTQNRYRLPSKEEWLMMAAVDKNTFKACQSANVSGQEAKKIRNKEDKYSCDDKYKFTAPVASFAINEIGLFDIQGNVSEWIACAGSPCQAPVAMGSSWFHGKQSNKLNQTQKFKANTAFSYVGFRLARDL